MPLLSRPTSLLMAALSPLAALLAQNTTVPATLQGVEGGSGTNIPFGSSDACRYQVLYDGEELPWQGPRVINGISLRADNAVPGTTSSPAKGFVFVTVAMSTTEVKAENASSEFRANWGADRMNVLIGAAVMLPAQPPMPGVRPANIDLMFTTPWVYGLTPARNNQNPPPSSLLVEILITSQPPGSYRIDNHGNCSSQVTPFGQVGPACAPMGGQNLVLTPDATMVAGASFTWTVTNAPANAPFWLFLHTTHQGGLFGQPTLPLPYPLFDPQNPSLPAPGIANLTRHSAPDCWLNLDLVASVMGLCDSNGRGAIVASLPAGRRFVGQSLHAQAIAYSQTANPLQLVTSLGQQTTVCGPLGVTRIYAFYQSGNAVPESGTRQLGQGMIFEVR